MHITKLDDFQLALYKKISGEEAVVQITGSKYNYSVEQRSHKNITYLSVTLPCMGSYLNM